MDLKKCGFGTMRLPLLNPDDPASIDLPQVEKMADLFFERGFRYVDTAYPYHSEHSEEAVRKCITDRFPRDSFLLADKMPILRVKAAEQYPQFFDEQRRRCNTEYFDYYLLHNLGRDRYINTERFGGFAFLERMKKAGNIRRIGFSFHDDAETLDRILTDHPEVDFVQIQLNYLDWGDAVAQSGKCY
ncbi:MAG: aldo/keto reductase, partial [Lachnospiraceae bacterium]|nr:aldo/keto reductase [Lachnospiraceae bacterium]